MTNAPSAAMAVIQQLSLSDRYLRHPAGDQRLVAAEVVTGQAASPFPQECPGVLAGTRLTEVVDHGFHVLERPWSVGPQVAGQEDFLP